MMDGARLESKEVSIKKTDEVMEIVDVMEMINVMEQVAVSDLGPQVIRRMWKVQRGIYLYTRSKMFTFESFRKSTS